MRPIPSSLLNMTATLQHATGTDAYANKTYGDEIALTKIYIEQTKSVTLGSLGEVSDGSLTLYFDCVFSLPVDTEFKRLDKVIFNSETYFARNATPCRNPMTGEIHHWEVTLDGN